VRWFYIVVCLGVAVMLGIEVRHDDVPGWERWFLGVSIVLAIAGVGALFWNPALVLIYPEGP